MDLEKVNGKYYLKCFWKGLEDSSLEPLKTLFEDVPDMVLTFLKRDKKYENILKTLTSGTF